MTNETEEESSRVMNRNEWIRETQRIFNIFIRRQMRRQFLSFPLNIYIQ